MFHKSPQSCCCPFHCTAMVPLLHVRAGHGWGRPVTNSMDRNTCSWRLDLNEKSCLCSSLLLFCTSSPAGRFLIKESWPHTHQLSGTSWLTQVLQPNNPKLFPAAVPLLACYTSHNFLSLLPPEFVSTPKQGHLTVVRALFLRCWHYHAFSLACLSPWCLSHLQDELPSPASPWMQNMQMETTERGMDDPCLPCTMWGKQPAHS